MQYRKHLNKLLAAFITSVGVFGLNSASAGINDVCSKVVPLGSWQYKSNSPVRASTALTSSIVRFALNPTIIFVGSNPTKYNRATAFDKKGNVLFTAPRLFCASKRGTCLARYKANETTANTRNMRRLAVKRTGSPEFIWRVSPSLCVRVPDGGQCYNVKRRELCDGRILK